MEENMINQENTTETIVQAQSQMQSQMQTQDVVMEKVVVVEKKEKKSKRRLFLLIFLLMMTGLLLSTSTYAWFTANQTVTVGTINVNVEAQNGIQLSADGTNWKSIVQTTDLKGVHSTTYTSSVNQIPDTLEPVSTAGNIDASGMMEMFYGVVGSNSDGEYILTATKDTEVEGTTGKFIAFDLFFRVDAATDIFLTTNSGVTTQDATDTGIKNASRIAFVVLGNTAAGSSISDIQGLNAGTSAQKYIWEPNYDVHTAAAVAHAFDTYGHTTTETGGALVPYSGVKAEIVSDNDVVVQQATPTAYSTLYADYFANVTPDYTTIAGFSTNQQIFSLQAGITKVRIYMWIEGQDVDCENNASGGTIDYNLQITTVSE